MCRNIRVLRQVERIASIEECEAAARQYVRKVTGYRVPSKANQEVFEEAVGEIAATTIRLMNGLEIRPLPARSSESNRGSR